MKINKLGVYKANKNTFALMKNDEFLVTGIDYLNKQFYSPAIGQFIPWNYPARFLGTMDANCQDSLDGSKSHPPNVRDHRAGRCDVAKQKRSLWPAPVHRLVGHFILIDQDNYSKYLIRIYDYQHHSKTLGWLHFYPVIRSYSIQLFLVYKS